MSRLRIALAGRDTCNGTCEHEGGCECLRPQVTEQQLDMRIAEKRAFAARADDAIERRAYCAGWRWGVIDGVLAGALITCIAFLLGFRAIGG